VTKMEEERLRAIEAKIKGLRKEAEELLALAEGIEAIRRNAERILASVKVLELNVCDPLSLED